MTLLLSDIIFTVTSIHSNYCIAQQVIPDILDKTKRFDRFVSIIILRDDERVFICAASCCSLHTLFHRHCNDITEISCRFIPPEKPETTVSSHGTIRLHQVILTKQIVSLENWGKLPNSGSIRGFYFGYRILPSPGANCSDLFPAETAKIRLSRRVTRLTLRKLYLVSCSAQGHRTISSRALITT